MNESHYLVPEHTQGLKKDIAHTDAAEMVEDAEDWFVESKDRLLNVNDWGKLGEAVPVGFRLTDAHGKAVKRNAHRGDHIEINNARTEQAAFDWAIIEAVEYDDYPDMDMETFALHLKPCTSPEVAADGNAGSNDATSTFVVERRGRHLYATYHGRNELALTAETAVHGSEAQAWLGMSDNLLNNLVKGLIGVSDPERGFHLF